MSLSYHVIAPEKFPSYKESSLPTNFFQQLSLLNFNLAIPKNHPHVQPLAALVDPESEVRIVDKGSERVGGTQPNHGVREWMISQFQEVPTFTSS